MRWAGVSLANVIAGFIYLLLLICVVGFLWWPARDELALEIEKANQAAAAMAKRAEGSLSQGYRGDLERIGLRLESGREGLIEQLAQRTRALSRWFPDASINQALGVPYEDTFQRAHAFAQDELERQLLARKEETSLATSPEIPLFEPPFQAEDRPPEDSAEMRRAQVAFNLERMLLLEAAEHEAFPVEATRIRTLTDPVETPFESIEARLALAMPSGNIPAVLREFREAEDGQLVIALEGVSLRLPEVSESLGSNERLPVILRVRLVARILELDSVKDGDSER